MNNSGVVNSVYQSIYRGYGYLTNGFSYFLGKKVSVMHEDCKSSLRTEAFDVDRRSLSSLECKLASDMETLFSNKVGKGINRDDINKFLIKYKDTKTPLAPCEYIALQAYTMNENYYQSIIRCARDIEGDDFEKWGGYTNIVKYLKSALSKINQQKNGWMNSEFRILYKGKKPNDPILTDKDFAEGELFVENGFFSTTPDRTIAFRFMFESKYRLIGTDHNLQEILERYYDYMPDPVLIYIIAKGGGVSIADLSAEQLEKEVLFASPKFKVLFKAYSEQGLNGMSRVVENAAGAWVVLLEENDITDISEQKISQTLDALNLMGGFAKPSNPTKELS